MLGNQYRLGMMNYVVGCQYAGHGHVGIVSSQCAGQGHLVHACW